MRHSRLTRSLLVVLSLVLAVPAGDAAPARQWRWRSTGGGMSSSKPGAIAVHPTDPKIALVGTADGAIYRTVNGGKTWDEVLRLFASTRETPGRGMRRSSGDDEAEDGENPEDSETRTAEEGADELEDLEEEVRERVYEDLVETVGPDEAEQLAEEEAEREVEERQDELEGEAERTQVEEAETSEISRGVAQLLFQHSDPQRAFAATTDGLWFSQDAGATWHVLFRGIGELEASTTSVAFTGAQGSTLLFGTRRGAWRQETDGTFARLPGAMGSAEIRHLAVHPGNPDLVAAATDKGSMVSTDGAISWETRHAAAGGRGDSVRVAFAPDTPGWLYVGTREGLWIVRNVREPLQSAERAEATGLVIPAISWIHTPESKTIIVTTPRGIFGSRDRGQTFTELARGLPTPVVTQITASAKSPKNYWVTSTLGVYRWRKSQAPQATGLSLSMGDLVQTAQAYAYEDAATWALWSRQVKRRYWLPRVRFMAGWGDAYAESFNLYDVRDPITGELVGLESFPAAVTPRNADSFFSVQMEWYLDELLKGTQDLTFRALKARQTGQRSVRVAKIARLGSELTEISTETKELAARSLEDKSLLLSASMARLQEMELQAYLDAATGGLLSRTVENETRIP